MKILSPVMSAVATEVAGAVLTVVTHELDFSVRAPFGIMVNRVALYGQIGGDQATGGLSLAVNLLRSPDVAASVRPLAGVDDAADFDELTSDVLAAGHLVINTQAGTVTDNAPFISPGPLEAVDFGSYPPEARPMTVRPMLLQGQIRPETGKSAQIFAFGCHILYQMIELTGDELVGLVSTR